MNTRDKLSVLLERNRGSAVSGEWLASELGVSRTAVWKAVCTLREEGWLIDAAPNSGYLLRPESDVLSAASLRGLLGDEWPGRLAVFSETGSTNTEAKRLAVDGAPHGTLVAAGAQTEGRGRRGRSFYSPAGTGLYMSLLLRRGTDSPLTVLAAVAVCRALERLTGTDPNIKWVNDVFINGRKVCGILSEAISDIETGLPEAVIVGIGANLRTEDFPAELRDIAGSVSSRVSRSVLAAEIARELLSLAEATDRTPALEEYRARSFLLGREVEFTLNGVRLCGTAFDINDSGNLTVHTRSGDVTLRSGEVSVKWQ